MTPGLKDQSESKNSALCLSGLNVFYRLVGNRDGSRDRLEEDPLLPFRFPNNNHGNIGIDLLSLTKDSVFNRMCYLVKS
jgi:hypothetical protein